MLMGDSSVSQNQAVVAVTTGQGSAAASSSMVEYPPIPSADHTLRRSGPPDVRRGSYSELADASADQLHDV